MYGNTLQHTAENGACMILGLLWCTCGWDVPANWAGVNKANMLHITHTMLISNTKTKTELYH